MSAIAVLSCVWQRLERLPYTLAWLEAQTYRDFKLILIVNNPAQTVRERVLTVKHNYELPELEIVFNDTNRGPYARLEEMVKRQADHEYFMYLDDDVNFDTGLLSRWVDQAAPHIVQGWNGFRFTGDYWTRTQVRAGEPAHYLWGSNLLVPRGAVDEGALGLEPRYWQCDDLYLCFYANHVKGLQLRKARKPLGVDVAIDGKDTYLSQAAVKVEFLSLLRGKGWAV